MKKSMVVLAALTALTGCAALLQDRPFDSMEYDRATRITVYATKAVHECVTPKNPVFASSLATLNLETMVLNEYEQNRVNSVNQQVSAERLRVLTKNFVLHKPYSYEFCVLALTEVQSASRTLARVLAGGAVHYDMCHSDVMTRFSTIEAAYKANTIAKDEFEELVKDLLELKKIDVAGCSVQNAQELKASLQIITQAYPYLSLL